MVKKAKSTTHGKKKKHGKKKLKMTPGAIQQRKWAASRGGYKRIRRVGAGKALSVDDVTAARKADKPGALRAMMINAQKLASVQLAIVLYALAAICSSGTFFTHCWATLIASGTKTAELRNHACGYLKERRLIITRDPGGRGRLALGVIVFSRARKVPGGWAKAESITAACVDQETAAKLLAQRTHPGKPLPDMWVWTIDPDHTEVFPVPVSLPNDGSQTACRLEKYDLEVDLGDSIMAGAH